MSEETPETPIEHGMWVHKDFTSAVRFGTDAFLQSGMGIPASAYWFYAVKVVVFVLGWMFFCTFTPGLGSPWNVQSWIFEGIAFQKAFIWASLFEVMGFGCTSGPLGAKVWPPFTAFLHFMSPGTLKQAPFPNLPLFGGSTRTVLDASLYAALLFSLVRALVQPEIEMAHLLPIVVLLPLCGLGDTTVILAARVEHLFAMIVCFLMAGEWIAASKWVQLGVWFWAGFSKLTPAFPYVVPQMTANNSMLKSQSLRSRLFRNPPDDVRPSGLAKVMAHAGGFLEFAVPLTLVWVTAEGPLLYLGLFFVVMLHGYIISNVPFGSVFEWNVLNLYAGFFLFLGYPEISLFAVGSVPMSIYLVIGFLVIPLAGNLFPSKFSFLVAMQYYAGNWAWSAWWFRDASYRKLGTLKRVLPLFHEQQQPHLTPSEAGTLMAAYVSARTLLLQGRVLGLVLPQAIEEGQFQRYTYVDGERVTDSVLGWGFGDGHLNNERLIGAIQEHCSFESGELRVICVEAQPLGGSSLHWRIVDAKDGIIAEGDAPISELLERQPWDYGAI